METQKIINLLNDSRNDESKFATKEWYVIDSQTAKNKYNQNNSIKFETEAIKSSFCDYADAFILVTGDVRVNDDVYMYIYTVYFYLRKNTTKNATRFGNKLSNKTS